MDYERDRVRINVEGDRLIILPDDLIQKIFSLIGTKQAAQMSVFSSKWRFMWTSMTCLDFSSEEFSRFPIYPADENVKKEVNMSPEVNKYLLDGSPSVTFTIVSREAGILKQEDIRAMRNSILAQSLMAELRELLEQEKPKPNTADMHNERKPTVENQRAQPVTKKQPSIEGKMKQIQNIWEKFTYKIQASGQKCKYIRDNMVSKLERIEGLLMDLPASKRAKIHASYSALCKETSIVMNEIMDSIKISSLHYQGSYKFSELANASLPSS
ncbi:F-box domain containing protein [Tanacetum coccineum]